MVLGTTRGVDMIGLGQEHPDIPDGRLLLHRHGTASGEHVQLLDGAVVPGIPDVRAEPTHLASVTRLRDVRRDEYEVRAYEVKSSMCTAIRLPRCATDLPLLRDWLGSHRVIEYLDDYVHILDRRITLHLDVPPGHWLLLLADGSVTSLDHPTFLTLFESAVPVSHS